MSEKKCRRFTAEYKAEVQTTTAKSYLVLLSDKAT